jgi:hypothetical protein
MPALPVVVPRCAQASLKPDIILDWHLYVFVQRNPTDEANRCELRH